MRPQLPIFLIPLLWPLMGSQTAQLSVEQLAIDAQAEHEELVLAAFGYNEQRMELNAERDRLIALMDREEQEIEPASVYGIYREFADKLRNYAEDPNVLESLKVAKFPLRVRAMLLLDIGIADKVKDALNQDGLLDHFNEIVSSTIPTSWKPPANFTDDEQERIFYIFEKSVESFARRRLERKDRKYTADAFMLPAEMRHELLKNPNFPLEDYALLNYDGQFNDTLNETLEKIRQQKKKEVELVDVKNAPEEFLRRRVLPRWKPNNNADQTEEKAIRNVGDDTADKNDAIRSRLSKLREEQNKQQRITMERVEDITEGVRIKRQEANAPATPTQPSDSSEEISAANAEAGPILDPRDLLFSPEYRQIQKDFERNEDDLIMEIFDELNITEDEYVDVGDDANDKSEAQLDVHALYTVATPPEYPEDPTPAEIESENFRKLLLTDFYEKLDAKVRIDSNARKQKKRLAFLNHLLEIIRDLKKYVPLNIIINDNIVPLVKRGEREPLRDLQTNLLQQREMLMQKVAKQKEQSLRSDHGKKYTMSSVRCLILSELCHPKLDVVFALGTSAGLEKAYKDHVQWASALTESLPVEPGSVRVAAVHDAQSHAEFPLATSPKAADTAKHLSVNEGEAHTVNALRKAENELFNLDRARNDAAKVIVLFTDGTTVEDLTQPAEDLRTHKGVKLYVASVAQPDSDQRQVLQKIAGNDEHIFSSDRLKNLRDALISDAERTRACIRIGGARSEYKHKPLKPLQFSANRAVSDKPPVRPEKDVAVDAGRNTVQHREDAQKPKASLRASTTFASAAPLKSTDGDKLHETTTPAKPCSLEEQSCEDAFETQPQLFTTKPLVIVDTTKSVSSEQSSNKTQSGATPTKDDDRRQTKNIVDIDIRHTNEGSVESKQSSEDSAEQPVNNKTKETELVQFQTSVNTNLGASKDVSIAPNNASQAPPTTTRSHQLGSENGAAKPNVYSKTQQGPLRGVVGETAARPVYHRPIPTRRPIPPTTTTSPAKLEREEATDDTSSATSGGVDNGRGSPTREVPWAPIASISSSSATRSSAQLSEVQTEAPVSRASRLTTVAQGLSRLSEFTQNLRRTSPVPTVDGAETKSNEQKLDKLPKAVVQAWRSVPSTTRRPFTPTGLYNNRTSTTSTTSTRPEPFSVQSTTTVPFSSTRAKAHASKLLDESVPCPHDILLLVDSSGSLGKSYDKQKQFLADLLRDVKIGPYAHRVALIQFAGAKIQKVEFSYDSARSAKDLLESVGQIRHFTGTTYIGAALSAARHLLETQRRRDVPSLLVLSSDGFSQDDALGPAQRVRALPDLALYAVSVGEPHNADYLERIVGDEELVFAGDAQPQLKRLIDRRLQCRP